MTPSDYANPDWHDYSRTCERKNYISGWLRYIWDSFSDEQKAAIANNAQNIADNEEWD